MSEQAENGNQPNETPAAGDTEHLIPKYRFDEVAAQLRAAREALQIKDEALSHLRQAVTPQQGQVEEDDEVIQALDPAQRKAVQKLLGKALNQARQELGGVVGALGNRVDEQNFLMQYGKDKSKYLPKIQELRKQHAARGAFLDYETAYKLIRVDELEEVAARKPAEPAKAQQVQQPAQSPAEKAAEAPPPAAPAAAKKSKTIEELEAEIDEQIKASGRSI